MQVLRAATAEIRHEAPGVIRRVMLPRFGSGGLDGVGSLRAVHLLDVDAGAVLPSVRLANLSVLRLMWTASGRVRWWRQDCGAGAEWPGLCADAALAGVELWVQTRRSNGRTQRAAGEFDAVGHHPVASSGEPGWDAPLSVHWVSAAAAAEAPQPCWWQQLTGESMLAGVGLGAGDGAAIDGPLERRMAAGAAAVLVSAG